MLKPQGLLLADYRSKEDSLYGKGIELEKDFYKLDNSCGSLSGISYAFREIDELKGLYEKCNMIIEEYEKHNHWRDKCKECDSHYIIWARKHEK